jgi:hypothetical protein
VEGLSERPAFHGLRKSTMVMALASGCTSYGKKLVGAT